MLLLLAKQGRWPCIGPMPVTAHPGLGIKQSNKPQPATHSTAANEAATGMCRSKGSLALSGDLHAVPEALGVRLAYIEMTRTLEGVSQVSQQQAQVRVAAPACLSHMYTHACAQPTAGCQSTAETLRTCRQLTAHTAAHSRHSCKGRIQMQLTTVTTTVHVGTAW